MFPCIRMYWPGVKVHILRRFWDAEEGATAIEYALMGTLIAIAIVAIVSSLGTRLSAEFSEISSALP